MGIAVADAAADSGAEVTLVLGPVNIRPASNNVKVIDVVDADSMAHECISRFPEADIAILAAAVADFTPEHFEEKKIKKRGDSLILRLKPTTDIAERLGRMKKPGQFLAGFALETDNELDNAVAKLKRKNLDLIVLNSLRDEGSGFGYDTNKVTMIDRNNNIYKFELKSKEAVAADIIAKIVSMINTPD